jgi:hypothetical protein
VPSLIEQPTALCDWLRSSHNLRDQQRERIRRGHALHAQPHSRHRARTQAHGRIRPEESRWRSVAPCSHDAVARTIVRAGSDREQQEAVLRVQRPARLLIRNQLPPRSSLQPAWLPEPADAQRRRLPLEGARAGTHARSQAAERTAGEAAAAEAGAEAAAADSPPRPGRGPRLQWSTRRPDRR